MPGRLRRSVVPRSSAARGRSFFGRARFHLAHGDAAGATLPGPPRPMISAPGG
jgi:hypothetical protein